jgi:hypothetical protein
VKPKSKILKAGGAKSNYNKHQIFTTMSKFEIYAAYDAIISLEASGDFRGACKKMKSINKSVSRRASKWQS